MIKNRAGREVTVEVQMDAILIGAGRRGLGTYSEYAERFPHKLKYVAVAEPDEEKRERFAALHGIPPERRFRSWEELVKQPQLARAAFIVTMDRLHFAPAMAMLKRGYHVIVEKPMSVDPYECVAMVRSAEKHRRVLAIGHVCRFMPFFDEIKRAIVSGSLGSVVNISLTENIGFWHFAQSYVRGNWGKAAESAPSILAKCCHDLDLLRWLAGSPVEKLSSMGGLFQFKPEQAPGRVPERCTDGCDHERNCPYSAYALYIDPARFWVRETVRGAGPEAGKKLEMLSESPYSRCVYKAGNDVCDNQVVQIGFENGLTATLTMIAHTRDDTRTIRVNGTGGELHGHLIKNEIRIRDFLTDKETCLSPEYIKSGHMGGDVRLIDSFIDSVDNGREEHLSSAEESLESHLMAFAAEESRLKGSVVDMKAFIRDIEQRVPGNS